MSDGNKIKPELWEKFLDHFVSYQRIYLPLILVMVLFLIVFFRQENGFILFGENSFFHLESVRELGINNFWENPYHLLLGLNVWGAELMYQLIPLVLSVLTLWLCYSVTKKLGIDTRKRFLLLFFLIISPAFIYTFTILNHYSLVIFLLLVGFWLFLREGPIRYLSFLFFGAITFFDLFSSLLLLGLLLIYLVQTKNKKGIKFLIGGIVGLAFVNILLGKSFLLGPYIGENFLMDLFSDLGGLFGFSLFLGVLGLVGLVVTWKKEKMYLLYFLFIFLVIVSAVRSSVLIYLNFLIVLFAAKGFNYLMEREWRLEVIKQISLFLLLLGVVFSSLSYVDGLIEIGPSVEMKDSLMLLRGSNRLVLSHPSDSYLIDYFSEASAFVRYSDGDYLEKMKIVKDIFNSTYISQTFPLLEENKIDYILLSPKVKEELDEGAGLLFVLQNERFKKIYDHENIEIWKFE